VGIRGIAEEIALAKILLLAWGQDRYAPETSAGIPLVMLNSLNLRHTFYSSDLGHPLATEGLQDDVGWQKKMKKLKKT